MQSMYEMFQSKQQHFKESKKEKKINKLSRSVIGEELSSVSFRFFFIIILDVEGAQFSLGSR